MRSVPLLGCALLALTGCQKGDSDTDRPESLPGVTALSGDHGVLLVADEAADRPWHLERRVDGEWEAMPAYAADTLDPAVAWWVPDGATGDADALRVVAEDGGRTGILTPQPVEVHADASGFDEAADGDDPITLTVSVPRLAGFSGSVQVARDSHGAGVDEHGVLSAGCTAGEEAALCFPDGGDDWLPIADLGAGSSLPSFVVDEPEARNERYTAAVRIDAHMPSGDVVATIGNGKATVVALGRVVKWGDLHGHTNLSGDGCEDGADECTYRGTGPARDFFGNAVAEKLDFAAITDHSEYDLYCPDGSAEGSCYEIWREEQDVVSDADGISDFVPLLGYEFTFKSDSLPNPDDGKHFTGGHKTVVFRDPAVCASFRIRAPSEGDDYVKGTAIYTAGSATLASSAKDLWADLDAADRTCGFQQALTFYHHGTVGRPQPVDWTNPVNEPDAKYETFTEVFSEHGSFECLDPTAEDCAWEVNPHFDHYPQGSLQEALLMGYRLGVVAGTDDHDGRPGSWEDGPSNYGPRSDDGAPLQQFAGGGITAVEIAPPYDRVSLFEGLQNRHTYASSGPRPDVLAWAEGADQVPYLVGSVVPVAAWPPTIHVHIRNGDVTVVRIELVAANGSIVAESEGPDLDSKLDPGQGVVYARAVLDLDGTEHRLWLSPFFPESR